MNRNDLTEGKVFDVLIRFAFPFIIANILQSLYGSADLYVVGKFCSPQSVAAVSTGTQVTQIITSLVSGLTVGGTVLIGNYMGKKETDNVKKSIGTTFTSFFAVSLILTFAMLILEDDILRLLNTPEESFYLTSVYISICALGNVFICGYNSVSAVLRGYGDSESPMIFISVSCILNIILDFIFVKYFKLNVAGTALATIISQSVSMFLAIAYLKKKSFIFDFKLQSFKIDKTILKRLISIGVPVSFQELLVRISFLYIAYAMNSCGLFAAAIVGIGSKYDNFAMLTSNSMASALTAITAQNMGAGKIERARKSLFLCVSFSFLVSFMFFMWAQISPSSMIGVFSKEGSIINAGIPYFKTASYDYIMTAFIFCLNGYLNGKEKTVWTMISTAFSAVVLRIPMTYYFTLNYGNDLGAIGTIAPAVSFITALYTLIYVVFEGKFSFKKKKQ